MKGLLAAVGLPRPVIRRAIRGQVLAADEMPHDGDGLLTRWGGDRIRSVRLVNLRKLADDAAA